MTGTYLSLARCETVLQELLVLASFCESDVLIKGPMHEIFCAKIFTQSKSVWVDDLGTKQDNLKLFLCLSLKFAILLFQRMSRVR